MARRTVHTPYEEFDIETVECASCGREMKKGDAYNFTIGEREGFACGNCKEEGPVSFPAKVKEKSNFLKSRDPDGNKLRVWIAGGWLLIPMLMLISLRSDYKGEEKFFQGVAWAGWVILLYYLLYLRVF